MSEDSKIEFIIDAIAEVRQEQRDASHRFERMSAEIHKLGLDIARLQEKGIGWDKTTTRFWAFIIPLLVTIAVNGLVMAGILRAA